MFIRSALLALLAALAVAAPAAAQSSPFDDCPAYGDQRICTAQVPSFDGTPLDVDLTLPEGGGERHPLIVLLHGFGNDKREWESLDDRGDGADKLRWNSHWFARHGFYVLTYTARGFRTGEPDEGKPPTPSGSSESLPSGTIQIKSREVEIRDTQYLASRAADAFADLDRDRVAVSGGSYGGGESWLQAADPVWDDFTSPPLRLQVAVPKYPWTDLGFALAPNGRGTLAGERPDRHRQGELHHRPVHDRQRQRHVRAGHAHDADERGADQRPGVERADRRHRRPVPVRGPRDRAGPPRPGRVPLGLLPGLGGRPADRRLLHLGLDRRPVRGHRVVPDVRPAQGDRPALAGRGRGRRRRPQRAQNRQREGAIEPWQFLRYLSTWRPRPADHRLPRPTLCGTASTTAHARA